jgi:hypothetical protein
MVELTPICEDRKINLSFWFSLIPIREAIFVETLKHPQISIYDLGTDQSKALFAELQG